MGVADRAEREAVVVRDVWKLRLDTVPVRATVLRWGVVRAVVPRVSETVEDGDAAAREMVARSDVVRVGEFVLRTAALATPTPITSVRVR